MVWQHTRKKRSPLHSENVPGTDDRSFGVEDVVLSGSVFYNVDYDHVSKALDRL